MFTKTDRRQRSDKWSKELESARISRMKKEPVAGRQYSFFTQFKDFLNPVERVKPKWNSLYHLKKGMTAKKKIILLYY